MLRSLSLEGFISESDSPEEAQIRLHPFALSQNTDALYMFGMIRAYCFQDIVGGVCLLRVAKALGHLRSTYSLGIMLRDEMKEDSEEYLEQAGRQGYVPALQEILEATEVRERNGGIFAFLCALEAYPDPACLTSLLNRHYESLPLGVYRVSSYCWNNRCGRWSYKQLPSDRTLMHENSFHIPFEPKVASVIQKFKDLDDSSSLLQHKLGKSKIKPEVSRMKVCGSCLTAKYCSKFCQSYDWWLGGHREDCEYLTYG